ncbi:MAG: pilus assembly protein PilP [Halomonas sp.]|uniref:pilus assembly protein PilP n=1 Tax=Halomonas sp. TaxID=1486246 RepID=UPI0028709CE5|nr:pilus assembly protein PilP [Halomonas sp.]MDR9439260.1 pilus assembly protein PilP [Halomonas sp.]
MTRLNGRHALLALGLGLLAACADPELRSLEQELAEVRTDPGDVPRVELPEIPQVDRVVYSGRDARSPFVPRRMQDQREAPQSSELAPSADRPREPLEAYDLSELDLVGTLTVDGEPSALVRGPDGKVYRVRIGDYMGLDHGRIVSITDDSLVLVETVLEKNAWQERTRQIALGEGE